MWGFNANILIKFTWSYNSNNTQKIRGKTPTFKTYFNYTFARAFPDTICISIRQEERGRNMWKDVERKAKENVIQTKKTHQQNYLWIVSKFFRMRKKMQRILEIYFNFIAVWYLTKRSERKKAKKGSRGSRQNCWVKKKNRTEYKIYTRENERWIRYIFLFFGVFVL